MMKSHPESYPVKADFRIDAVKLREQITSRAKTVLWVLLAAAGLVFVIACSNVANLILARTVRREGELAVRAALGASTGALRRTLLAESLLLGGAGAALGILSARPMAGILARYASRFSVRALDMTVDSSMLWVGAALAVVAALLLAFVPRLPSADAAGGFGMAGGGTRVTSGTRRRLRIFAVTQIAASFLLLAGAGMLLKTLLKLQSVETGFDTRHVLVLNVPAESYGRSPEQTVSFYKEAIRRITDLPGVDRVAVGILTPWRDGGTFGPGFQFTVEGRVPAPGEDDPRGRMRTISPGFFTALGIPLIGGRDFNEADRKNSEPVVIISQSLAQRMFPSGDAVNHHLRWTDPLMKFIDIGMGPRRIVGVAGDVDDENVVPGPALTVYSPFEQQILWGGRLFIHAHGDLYSLVTPVTRIIRQMSPEQPVEHAATLEDIRTEVLTPDRLNTLVFGGFAAVALAIAVVGVAGVLAFSVSQRTREFGIRLAVGAAPRHLVTGVLTEGVVMAGAGVLAGAVFGYGLAQLAGVYFEAVQLPGMLVLVGSAVVLLAAAVVASVLPAMRAARVDVLQALHSD
jgi:predicted permease